MDALVIAADLNVNAWFTVAIFMMVGNGVSTKFWRDC